MQKNDKKPDKKTKQDKALEKKAKQDKKLEKKSKQNKKKSAKDAEPKKNNFLGGLLFAKMARAGANELSNNADEVNKLNVFPVPDGDTGDNMKMTIEAGIAAIEAMDSDDLSEVMNVLSHGMLLGARGNSGVILSQFFAGIAKGFENEEQADPAAIGRALQCGVKRAYTTVMTPTEGTILTVAREAVEFAVSKITAQTTVRSFFSNLVKEMHASLERTPELLPQLKEAGVVDSGGAGLFHIIDGFNKALNGKEVTKAEGEATAAPAKSAPVINTNFGPDSEMKYGYCTEALVQLMNAKTDIDAFDTEALKSFLSEIGNSIVAFKTDSIVKLHVHTMTPEKVLEYCRRYGEFITVKIENMSVQHTALEEEAESSATPSRELSEEEDAPYVAPTKKYGVVAVSNGVGISEIFRDLGADEIIYGGQTSNPSAKEFLNAFNTVAAENIFVLPNNSNILLAAEQAAKIYTEKKIYVIPSKNIGTGYIALSSFDFENENPEEIVSSVTEAMTRVSCGYISPAIRDTEMNGLSIKNGDTIGIMGKEIVVCDEDRVTATHKLASLLLSGEDKFMLTVFRGKDATPAEYAEVEKLIKESYPDAEVYAVDGEQDIYPYIFIAE